MKRNLFLVGIAMLALSGVPSMAAPQGTAFTYQGKLTSGGEAANGNYDMWFKLYTLPSGGTQVGSTVTFAAQPVSNGLFTVSLDFGAFTGEARWLDINVHTNDPAAPWVWLSPRQPITPVPSATYSPNAGVALTASNVVAGGISAPSIAAGQVVKSVNGLHDDLTLTPGSGVTITPNGNTLQISASGGSGAGWSLSGNSLEAGQFLGSLNSQPLEFMANGSRALRIEPTWLSPNMVGGSLHNSVSSGALGATVAGGGYSPVPNQVTGNFGFVGGGAGNIAGESAVVAGGGGSTAAGTNATVGGGQWNSASGAAATVAGGRQNRAASDGAFIGGGIQNVATGEAATVPGGTGNEAAGANSFAAGSVAHAVHSGAFVWGDATYHSVTSSVPNQFLVQASGGVRFQSSTAPMVTVDSSGNLSTRGSIGSMAGPLALQTEGLTGLRLELCSSFGLNVIGGVACSISPDLENAAIGGGYHNTIEANASGSVIGGGQASVIQSNANYATIGGGMSHFIKTNSYGSVIAGGWNNVIEVESPRSTIAGGHQNAIGENADHAGIGGGFQNIIRPYGAYGTIPGGYGNSATAFGFAAGRRAKALWQGDFVWADSTDADFNAERADEFAVRASGGVRIESNRGIALNDANAPLITRGADPFDWHDANKWGLGRWGMFMEPKTLVVGIPSEDAGDRYFQVCKYEVNGDRSQLLAVNQAGTVYATTFSPTSARASKENFTPVDARTVLDKVAALPLAMWNFKSDQQSRHLGPVAEDFRASFGLGGDDKHIATVDADGVAFAAIQGLNQKLDQTVKAKDAEIQALRQAVAELQETVNRLVQPAK